jgi:hypothetical protein
MPSYTEHHLRNGLKVCVRLCKVRLLFAWVVERVRLHQVSLLLLCSCVR